MKLKVLFVGLGSIGTRHLTNLHASCLKKEILLEVTALRHSNKSLAAEIENLVNRQILGLDETKYDIAFITNPTYLHEDVILKLKGKVKTFFIEKPIFEDVGKNLTLLGLHSKQKAYVAAPMRWCGVYRALKEKLANLSVFSVRAICSSYLPNWRPNADYRKIYSAIKKEGGGVPIDLIHEWDYLVDLFGVPCETLSFGGKFSNLEISSEDLAVYIARYDNFLCELHLDYFGREYKREVEIFTKDGSIVANFANGELSLPNDEKQNFDEPINRRYEREMEYFLNYALCGEGESVNSPRHAMRVLETAILKG